MDQYVRALDRIAVNDAARKAPVGGSFTREGVENLAHESAKNLYDMKLLSSITGIGGSMAPAYGVY